MLAKLRPAKKQKQPRARRENASVSPGTYVYREPLGVLQISEYFVGREGYAFVHGVTTCASVKSNTFRHGRQGLDAACVTWLRHRGRPIRRHVRGFRGAPPCQHVGQTEGSHASFNRKLSLYYSLWLFTDVSRFFMEMFHVTNAAVTFLRWWFKFYLMVYKDFIKPWFGPFPCFSLPRLSAFLSVFSHYLFLLFWK